MMLQYIYLAKILLLVLGIPPTRTGPAFPSSLVPICLQGSSSVPPHPCFLTGTAVACCFPITLCLSSAQPRSSSSKGISLIWTAAGWCHLTWMPHAVFVSCVKTAVATSGNVPLLCTSLPWAIQVIPHMQEQFSLFYLFINNSGKQNGEEWLQWQFWV